MRISFVLLGSLAILAAAACRPGLSGSSDGDADVDGDADADGTLCVPGLVSCQGIDVVECNSDGSGWRLVQSCEAEGACLAGTCVEPCAAAAAVRSYEGCEYRAVTLANWVSPDFAPAIVVGNRNDRAAEVTVSRGASVVARATVAPSSTETIELPWVLELKGDASDSTAVDLTASVEDGSYRVVSTLPVTVYQFNPLEYRLPRDCEVADVMPGDGECFSYSNDASLLLPVHVLTEHYIVMSRAPLAFAMEGWDGSWESFTFSPAVFAVVNPGDGPVTVSITFSAPSQAGPGVAAYRAGETGSFVIPGGGVLQIASEVPATCSPETSDGMYGYCQLQSLDPTGTVIEASAPVAVFGGHNCAFVPYDRWACDHLEEQLFPYETWGEHYVVAQSHRENGEPDVWRILSGADDNVVRFTPPSVHGELRLDRGEHAEIEAWGSFEIHGEAPILVGRFLVGQNYNELGSWGDPPGDPAFALEVPSEQWRTSYDFLAPTTYEQSYVNITTTEAGRATVVLDGAALAASAWTPVGSSGFVSLGLEIPGGSHHVAAEAPFGITVYGYGQYTSYVYPGGLDLEQITVW